MQGRLSIWKLINVIQYKKRIKVKKRLLISIEAVKAFDKIQQCSMIKVLKKLGMRVI
jgi:hypothetical protein